MNKPEQQKFSAEQTLKPVLGPVVKAGWVLGSQLGASQPTVALTGAPRSGTTWLLEMLERTTGARRIYEPCHLAKMKRRKIELGWRPWLPPEADHPALRHYLSDLFSGREISLGSMVGNLDYSPLAVFAFAKRLLFAPGTVIKFCRVQRLLPWITERFDVPIILLIRNPLAVVASQMASPLWDYERIVSSPPAGFPELREAFPQLMDYACSLTHAEEIMASVWAFDYLIPFSQWDKLDGTRLVAYEDLVQHPGRTLRKVINHFGLPSNESHEEFFRQPSASTEPGSNVLQGNNPLTTWRQRLTAEEVDRILAVVRRFGLDFYGQGLVPNRDHFPSRKASIGG